MTRRMIRAALILFTVTAVAVATVLILDTVAGAAGAAKPFRSTTTISIGSQAHLAQSPFGPGLNVTVKYSCFPAGYGKGGYPGGFGSVNATDLLGHQGFGSFSPVCNDKNQSTTVFVPGFFVAGSGAANAFVCGFECAGTSREIKIS